MTRAPMTPATYLAKRRAASGWSAADIDSAADFRPGMMACVEAGAEPVSSFVVAQLRGLIAFNPSIVRGLANGLPMVVCGGCGCSEYDPCEQGCCGRDAGLCSACRRVGAAAEAKCPPPASAAAERVPAPAPDLFSDDWTR